MNLVTSKLLSGAIKGALAEGPLVGVKKLIGRAVEVGALGDGVEGALLQCIKDLDADGVITMERHAGTVKVMLSGGGDQMREDRASVLEALKAGELGGVTKTAQRSVLSMPADSMAEQRARVLAALKELKTDGMVVQEQTGSGRVIKLTAKGRRACESRGACARIPLAILTGCGITGATVLVAGCMSMNKQEARVPLMGYPVPVGIQQVRDPGTGATYFQPCNPCASVTPKTAIASADSYKAPEAPVQEMGERQERVEVARAVKLESDLERKRLVDEISKGKKDVSEALRMDTEFASAKRIVPFSFAAGEIGPQGKEMVAQMLPFAKEAQKVYIRGRTDSTGRAEANRLLAMTRAVKVRGEFVSGGVDQSKIKTTYCTTCYIAANDTEAGRRANRRVEIELVMPKTAVRAMEAEESRIAAAKTPKQAVATAGGQKTGG